MRTLLAAVCCVVLAAETHAVVLRVQTGESCRTGGIIRAQQACTAPCEPITRVHHLTPDALQNFELDSAAAWRLELVEPSRCWTAPLDVPAGASGETFEFRLWKAAHLRGRVGVASGDTLPQQVSVAFQLPGSAHNARIEVACPVARASRSWMCSMPAAKLDLRAAAPGFAPHYLWDIDLSAAQTIEIGELQLARGASIAGWVSSEDPSVELRETAVKLLPLTFAAQAPGATTRDALRVDQTKPNARGFFQFGNVPPGVYSVTAEKAGLSRAVRDDIRIGDANEHLLEVPLTLRRMATVDALISPPLDPFGAPWQISLRKRMPQTSSFIKEVASGPATMSGGWRSDDLEAGTYLLRVSDSRGAVYESEQIDVASDAPLVNIVVRAVAVEGTLRVGGAPARAELRFRPMRGNGSTVLTSGDDGTFSGVLTREGKWRVEVALPSGQTREVTELEVRRRATEERARVDVQLPEGRIAGNIVDAQGQPISGAVLVFRNGEPYADVKTDAAGEFELIGLDEGTFEVQGTTRDGASAALPVTVDEGPPQRLTLVVAKRRQVAGRVVSGSGAPLAGAVIRYVLDRSGFVGETVSSPTGRFTLETAAASRMADLLILTPGLPAKLVAISLAEQRGSIDIRVADAGGQLLLQVEAPPPWPFIFRGDAAAALPLFRRPDGANGRNAWHHERGIALLVEPGQYLVCPMYAPSAHCISTEVPAGGTALVNTTSWSARQDRQQTEER